MSDLTRVLRSAAAEADIRALPEPPDSCATSRSIRESAMRCMAAIGQGPGLADLPVAFVCPIEGGGLQIEWDYGDRHLEIEWVDPDTVVALWNGGRIECKTAEFRSTDVERIVGLLKWLLRTEERTNGNVPEVSPRDG